MFFASATATDVSTVETSFESAATSSDISTAETSIKRKVATSDSSTFAAAEAAAGESEKSFREIIKKAIKAKDDGILDDKKLKGWRKIRNLRFHILQMAEVASKLSAKALVSMRKHL